jgi:Rrf2 family nitric oxide-sensitive transcriptional repressor
MQLTFFTDYGLRTLMYVAANAPRTCSVREISDHFGISRNHLVKVVHRLSQLGYVASAKGKGGGIKLAHPADKLKLGALVRTLEPSMDIVECFDPATNTCRIISSCQLKHFLMDANKAFIASLDKHTLADAIAGRSLFVPHPTNASS